MLCPDTGILEGHKITELQSSPQWKPKPRSSLFMAEYTHCAVVYVCAAVGDAVKGLFVDATGKDGVWKNCWFRKSKDQETKLSRAQLKDPGDPTAWHG